MSPKDGPDSPCALWEVYFSGPNWRYSRGTKNKQKLHYNNNLVSE